LFNRINKFSNFILHHLWKGKINKIKLASAFFIDILTASIKVIIPLYIIEKLVSEDLHLAFTNLQTLALIVATFVLANILPIARGFLLSSVRSDTQADLLEKLLRKTYSLKLDEHITAPTGKFPQMLTAVYSSVEKVIPSIHEQFIPSMVSLTFIISGLFFVDTWLGLVSVCALFVYVISTAYNASLKGIASKKRLESAYGAYGGLLAAINRYRIAHQFNNVEHEVSSSRKILDKQRQSYTRLHTQEVINLFRNNIIIVTCIASIILICFRMSSEESIISFSIFYASYLITIINEPLRTIGVAIEQIHIDSIECEKIVDFMDEKSEIIQNSGKNEFDDKGCVPEIRFKDLSFSYNQNDNLALSNINLTIQPGQKIAIVGESGSGKSTLFNLLQRFYANHSGNIYINNHKINEFTPESIRSQISVVSQNPMLFQSNVYENIRYADWSVSKEHVEDLLKKVQLNDWLESNSLDEDIGNEGDKLSGGQKQRVALARALLKGGNILLLDEATSALDVETEKDILETTYKLAKEKTIIAITHRITSVINSDVIVYMKKGKIIEKGNFLTLFNNKGAFFKQLEVECNKIGMPMDKINPNKISSMV
jgi:ABC-type multidrug transport system fused ATPase/permease subunit